MSTENPVHESRAAILSAWRAGHTPESIRWLQDQHEAAMLLEYRQCIARARSIEAFLLEVGVIKRPKLTKRS